VAGVVGEVLNHSTPAGWAVVPGVSAMTAMLVPSGDQVGRSSSSGTGVVHDGCAAGALVSAKQSELWLFDHSVKTSTVLPATGANTGRWKSTVALPCATVCGDDFPSAATTSIDPPPALRST